MIPGDWSHPGRYAVIELERRFLLNALPADLPADAPFFRITDLYVTGIRLRVRRMESPTGKVLALKLGQKYRATDQPDWQTTMTNLYLNETEYQLLSTLEGRLLIKKRYPYHHTGRDYSVDVFEGPLTGLILLETEGRSIDDLLCIPIPAFAVREVTDDQSFTGGALVKLSPEEFQQWQASWPDER